jgi:hypothetical protein
VLEGEDPDQPRPHHHLGSAPDAPGRDEADGEGQADRERHPDEVEPVDDLDPPVLLMGIDHLA